MSYAISVVVRAEYVSVQGKGMVLLPSLKIRLNSPCIPRKSEYIKANGSRYMVESVKYEFRDNGYLSEVKLIVRRG